MSNVINWDEAPEGATHWGDGGNGYVDGWFKIIKGDSQYFMRPHNKKWIETRHPRLTTELINRPVTPCGEVYTQAMSDNGVLPSVGMECKVKSNALKSFNGLMVRIIGINKHSDGDNIFTFENELEGIGCATILAFKPIEPPIELIEKGIYRFDSKNKPNLIGEAYYTEIGKLWMMNALRTNTSYKSCDISNIVLLTPEVKS